MDEKIKEIERPLAKTTVNAALLDQPTVRITLTNPVATAGFYGLSKQWRTGRTVAGHVEHLV